MKGLDRGFVNKALLVAALAFAVLNIDKISGVLGAVGDAFRPLFLGIIIAVVVDIPTMFFEKKLFSKCKKLKKPLSLSLSILLVVGFLLGLGFLIIPEVVKGVKELSVSFSQGEPLLDRLKCSQIGCFLAENIEKVYENTINRFQEYLPKMLSYAQNVVKALVNTFLGLFFALMILINKEGLKRQMKKTLNRFIKKERVKRLVKACELGLNKFSRFLGGQLIEAAILGVVCYVCLLILRMPYSAIIAVITAVANLVPMLGAYIGGFISALLIFTVSPTKALIFVIFIVILQQVESVTTYPVIVGKYVGLSSFWILAAVVLGGGLFGVVGMIFGVPVTAFLHDFIGEIINKKPYKGEIILR